MRTAHRLLCVLALSVWAGGGAYAQEFWPIDRPPPDSFFDVFFETGLVAPAPLSGGTGYDRDLDGQGDWIYYPNTGWTNQWFYNAPLDMNRYKEIFYDMQINPFDPNIPNSWVTVVINWSSPLWPSGTGAPPLDLIEDPIGSGIYRPILPPEEQEWIVRDLLVYEGPVPLEGLHLFNTNQPPIFIPYNPEWVSIDVIGSNVAMTGLIYHACLPEPASFAVLSVASLLLFRRR
ncbi:MAG: hypothetical protein IT443_12650 [Phycisphaeraceae bacterium]|nr:hypothetical protein [Phycisphaeraceae bacterium]